MWRFTSQRAQRTKAVAHFYNILRKMENSITRTLLSLFLRLSGEIQSLRPLLNMIRFPGFKSYRRFTNEAVVSHRSAETGDTRIAGYSVASSAGMIRTGASSWHKQSQSYSFSSRLCPLNYCVFWKHEPEPQRNISYPFISYDFLSFIVFGYYQTTFQIKFIQSTKAIPSTSRSLTSG